VLQDLRFAFRLIARERWFSATAILALAFGIGVNVIGFTLVNAAFFRGLPFEDAGRLYTLTWQRPTGGPANLSHRELQDWREQSHAFVGLAGYSTATMNLSDDRVLPEYARGAWLTANAFAVLGQPLLLGRDFASGDDRKGAEPVVILGYDLWKNRYGADPDVLGRSLRLNGQASTIIGVMPDGMKFPGNTDVWAPFVPTDALEKIRPLNVFGRLRDDGTRKEAQAESNVIAQRLAAAYPNAAKDRVGVRVETFTERFVGGAGRTMFIAVMGAVGFVLLIACANVANLLLSRSAHRAREIAIRTAVGATRWRVVRQLLLESLVLAAIGGSIGLLLALAGVKVFDAAVHDPDKPYWIVFTVDYVVFGYVATICGLTAVLFGLAPALHVAKTNANDVLKDGGRGSTSQRARWLSGTMVVAELALTVVLLAGAGLMVRSFVNLHTGDVGFRLDNLMAMRLQLPDSKYASVEARRAFYEQLHPRLVAIAGVEAVAVTTSVPLFDADERLVELDGRERTPEQGPPRIATVTVSPQFFDAVGLSMLRGRSFHASDGAPGSEAVIINERMAAQVFPGTDPIGRRLRFARPEVAGQPAPVWCTIVGISPSIRHGSQRDIEADAVIYVPYRHEPPESASLLIRSRAAPDSIMDAVRRQVRALDRDQPVFTIQTVAQMLWNERWPFRVFGGLFAILAVIALTLSSVGLYAVMAYSVTQRTHEIGVRMAVGAQAWQVTWLILGRGLTHLAIGLTIGLAGALALSRVLRRMLVQVTATDPVTFAAITILLTIVSIAACLLPAYKATRIDPLVALRAD